MKTSSRIILSVIAAVSLFAACTRGPKQIPESKFVQIYGDMLIADAWLADHQEVREKADTCLFYEAVFQKYGYTRDDFLYSISQRVKDVEKFAKTMENVEEYVNYKQREALGESRSKFKIKKAKVKEEDEVIITSIQ